jgi:acetylornithine deacetylase/succinyl-diaminopimelate desuccinylase-like protein
LDRRINPPENLEREKARLSDLFQDLSNKEIDFDIEAFQKGSSSGVPEDGTLARARSARVEKVTGMPVQFEMCPGLLATRFYAELLPGLGLNCSTS